MDLCAEFNCALEHMPWGEVVSTIHAFIYELLGEIPNPPPPSPPVPAGLVGIDTHPELVESLSGGYGEYTVHPGAPPFEQPSPLMATPGVNAGQTPPTIYEGQLYDGNVIQSGHLYNQAGAHSQGQYLTYQWPVDGAPTAAATSYSTAPPHPDNHVPAVRLPEGLDQNLTPVGVRNGEVRYRIAADVFAPYIAAPPVKTSVSKKRKRESQQRDDRQYVKKPPNAFMLFLKEQRPNVVAGLKVRESVLVNAIVGQRWKLLSNEEKAKYYEEADKERRLHSQKYPDWSSRDNYGKKRKRNRGKAPTSVEASASKPGEVIQPANKLCLTSEQTTVMVPSMSQTAGMDPSTSQTTVMEPSTSQTAVMEPSTSQTAVMEPSTSQTAVMEPSTPQTAVMEPSTSQTAVMEPSTSQTAVMEPSTPQTTVMEPSTPQTAGMEPSTSQTAGMEPSTIDSSDGAFYVTESSDGAFYFTESSDGTFYVIDSSDGAFYVTESSDGTLCLTESSDGAFYVTESSDGAFCISESSDGAVYFTESSDCAFCITEAKSQTAVMVPSASERAVMEPSTSQR